MAKPALFFSLFVLLTTFARAWDPFGIFDAARKKNEQAGDKLIGKAKQAFDESMQELFDDEIQPLINKANAMALEDLGLLKQDVEEIVNGTIKRIEDMVDQAALVAQQFVDKALQDIKDKIIDEVSSKFQDAENFFFQGLNGFLQKFYEVVSKINCMVQGDVDRIYEDIYKLMSGTGCTFGFVDKCCRDGRVVGKRLSQMGDTQLYALEVCRRTSGLDIHTPVEVLKAAYVDCQIAAKKFYCTNFGTATAKDFFTKEYNKWGVSYDFWAHPSATQVEEAPASPARALDDCGTPLECYEKAIAKLNEARAEIQGKADMSVVQPLIDAQAREQAVQAQELKVFSGDACPEGWVEAEVTKGYVLVGRPQDGLSGTQINTAFTNGEKSRVPPHGHRASVNDNGHSHSVSDPGHSHDFWCHGEWDGYTGGGVWTDDNDHLQHTGREYTGVSVDRGTCDIQVTVEDAEGEGYPMAYVLLCQRASEVVPISAESVVI